MRNNLILEPTVVTDEREKHAYLNALKDRTRKEESRF